MIATTTTHQRVLLNLSQCLFICPFIHLPFAAVTRVIGSLCSHSIWKREFRLNTNANIWKELVENDKFCLYSLWNFYPSNLLLITFCSLTDHETVQAYIRYRITSITHNAFKMLNTFPNHCYFLLATNKMTKLSRGDEYKCISKHIVATLILHTFVTCLSIL